MKNIRDSFRVVLVIFGVSFPLISLSFNSAKGAPSLVASPSASPQTAQSLMESFGTGVNITNANVTADKSVIMTPINKGQLDVTAVLTKYPNEQSGYISRGNFTVRNTYPVRCLTNPCPTESTLRIEFGHCSPRKTETSSGLIFEISGLPVTVEQIFTDTSYNTDQRTGKCKYLLSHLH